MAKFTSVVFPFRSPSGGVQSVLTACRAWRIIAVPVADLDSDKAAVIDQKASQAPTGCKDGIYPVWVKATRPTDDSEIAGRRYVNGDGWQTDAMGKGWQIEYVGSSSNDANTTQYAYIVETTDTLDDAGQVNNAPFLEPILVFSKINVLGTQTVNLDPQISLPRGTRGLWWHAKCTTFASSAGLYAVMDFTLASGAVARLSASFGTPTAQNVETSIIVGGVSATGAVAVTTPPGGLGVNIAVPSAVSIFGGHVMPRKVQLGLYDGTVNNRWTVDCYALP